MKSDFQEQDAIAYFLGELPEAEQSAIEERFFSDAEFSEWLDEVEVDLIDSYVRDELDGRRRRDFETNYLVSENRRDRVRAAAAIRDGERSTVPAPSIAVEEHSFREMFKRLFNAPQLAFGALAVLLLSLVVGVFVFRHRSTEIVKVGNGNVTAEQRAEPLPTASPEIAPSRAPAGNANGVNSIEPKKSPANNVRETEPQDPKPGPRSPVTTSVELFSSVSRSGSENRLNSLALRPETRLVYLRPRFKTEEEFDRYRLELRDAGGKTILTRVFRDKSRPVFRIQADKFRKGIYRVELQGAKADGDFELLDVYELSVEKR
ncbi:MAG TPA: hypothetical protein PKO33_01540 [Pyrinomonadaceae bacterium]|nr:hypothetical protein [Pyrinomonadaceae bacterium]